MNTPQKNLNLLLPPESHFTLHPLYSPVRLAITTALCLFLTGCGVEMAGTAATVGAAQATQAEQAIAQKEQILDGVKKAQEAQQAQALRAANIPE